MSRVVDLWHRKDRTKTARYGKGRRWQAVYTDGAGRERKTSHDTKDSAQAWLVAQSHRPARARVTFDDYAQAHRDAQVHQAPTTRETLGNVIKRSSPHIGGLIMEDITRADIQAMVLDWAETLAPSTMQTYLRHLSSIFNTALDDEVIRRSPTSRVRLPRAREPGDAEFLTTETVERVRDFFGDTIWADAVTVAAGTGLRPSEWAGVTVDRVDVKARTIRVDRQLEATRGARVHRPLKTVASRRTVDYGGRVVDVMDRLVGCANHQGLIFHDDGRMLIESARLSAWHRMRSVVPEAGPGWHQLRHFHASFLLSHGASVVAVARRLGHKDATETLRTYAHVMPSDGVALASIMADGGF